MVSCERWRIDSRKGGGEFSDGRWLPAELLMVGHLRSVYHLLRKHAGRLWGRAWRLRSMFVSAESKRKCDRFLHAHEAHLFFVFGTGRSGTQLISDLLSRTGDACVFHEPDFYADVETMDSMRRDKRLAVEYWQKFRSLQVCRRWHANPESRLYGEVNGTIRFQASAIAELYPEAKLFLVSRDGRGVVRSVMGWPQFYSPSSRGAYAIKPLMDDPCHERWDSMSRFEKICWSWADANRLLILTVRPEYRLQLERLSTDYEYCMDRLLEPLGIELSPAQWREHVSRKSRNASSSYAFPSWNEWTREQQQSFQDICGDTMEELGYFQ